MGKLKTVLIIIAVVIAVLFVLSILGGALIIFVASADNIEYMDIIKITEPVSDETNVIHLTEEDFEKYPFLKDVPARIQVRVSAYSKVFPNRDSPSIDKETANEVYKKYSGILERNGEYYTIMRLVS